MLDAPVPGGTPLTREQTLEQKLEAERARGTALEAALAAKGSADPSGGPSEELLAKFDAEIARRDEATQKAFDELRERAAVEVTEARAAADELAKKLAAADEELVALRAKVDVPAPVADASAPAADLTPIESSPEPPPATAGSEPSRPARSGRGR